MSASSNLVSLHPQDFVDFLKSHKINRFYFVFDRESQRVVASHQVLQPIADFIGNDRRDFNKHEGLFLQIATQLDTLQGAFVHRTCRGQAAGGVRYWQYETVEAFLRDGLRLSKGMTRKNALAGIWWGGGKGVMALNSKVDKYDPHSRAILYRDYGKLMTSIRGCYVTAEDAGTNVQDMANVFAATRFTTCIPPSLGGSGNPSVPTARGVVCGMEAALDFLGLGSLEGKTVAVQGVGNVGEPLLGFLLEKGVRSIVASDVNQQVIAGCQSRFQRDNVSLQTAGPGDTGILATDCDILAPCATGAILNAQTIPTVKAKIVCGAANNQLEDTARDDRLLHERGILYVPDFLTNRMGIVNCANEQYGYVKQDVFIEQHFSRDWEQGIFQTALRVFRDAKDSGDPPAKVATRLADELSLQPHPIFGHRGQAIIDSLVADRWFEQTDLENE